MLRLFKNGKAIDICRPVRGIWIFIYIDKHYYFLTQKSHLKAERSNLLRATFSLNVHKPHFCLDPALSFMPSFPSLESALLSETSFNLANCGNPTLPLTRV